MANETNGRITTALISLVGVILVINSTYNTVLLNWTRNDVQDIKIKIDNKVDKEQYRDDKSYLFNEIDKKLSNIEKNTEEKIKNVESLIKK